MEPAILTTPAPRMLQAAGRETSRRTAIRRAALAKRGGFPVLGLAAALLILFIIFLLTAPRCDVYVRHRVPPLFNQPELKSR